MVKETQEFVESGVISSVAHPYLIFHSVSGAMRIPLTGSNYWTIGRGQGNMITLPDIGISRNHATVQIIDKLFHLIDLGSCNGSYVNGRRVTTPVRLKNGDRLTLGETLLDFFCTDFIYIDYKLYDYYINVYLKYKNVRDLGFIHANFRLEEALLESLKSKAFDEGVTTTHIVVKALKQYISGKSYPNTMHNDSSLDERITTLLEKRIVEINEQLLQLMQGSLKALEAELELTKKAAELANVNSEQTKNHLENLLSNQSIKICNLEAQLASLGIGYTISTPTITPNQLEFNEPSDIENLVTTDPILDSKPELSNEVVSNEGFHRSKAFEIARERGYVGNDKSFRDSFERSKLGEKFGLTRIPVQGKQKWLYFDNKNLG